MANTKQWTWRDQLGRIIQISFVFFFVIMAMILTWNAQNFSAWFVGAMNNTFDIPESSQRTLSAIGIIVAAFGTVVLGMSAIVVINMRPNLRFRKRLGRAIMLLLFLGWLALLFLLIAIFLLGETDGAEFFGNISSGLSTEIIGAFLAVLLLDTFGRSWEEWDEESIRISEGQKPELTQLAELARRLKQRKQEYSQAQQEAQRLSKSLWGRLSRNYLPPSYYEGAIAALDSVLSDLPAEDIR